MMTAEEIESHWDLLAQAVDTLLNLKPGEYPPISYEQTYSAVYKCVCHGFGDALYMRLLGEMDRQLKLFSERLQIVSDDELVEAFNNTWSHFSLGLSGIVPIFNYLARFYVEAKLNLNLRSELMKLFDKTVLQAIFDRLFWQLRIAQNTAFVVQPSTMESVVRALYKIRPNTVKELPDLYRRFIPELIQHVRLDELPDLQNEARRMITEARTAFENRSNLEPPTTAAFNSQCRPLVVGTGQLRFSNDTPSADITTDFQMEEDLPCGVGLDPVCDPVTNIERRGKRTRDDVDSGDEGNEDIADDIQMDPDEPSPSPRSSGNYRLPTTPHAGTSGCPSRKHFHPDNGSE